jgi:hypothetical protein
LVQAVCASLVRYLNEQKRMRCEAADVAAIAPAVFDEYRNYFIDIAQSLSPEAHAVLDAIVAGVAPTASPRLLRLLEDRDYIEPDEAAPSRYRFQVPLLGAWWQQRDT